MVHDACLVFMKREAAGANRFPLDAWDTVSLARAVARGEAKAVAAFYERWFDETYAYARRFAGCDEATALDIVQEAFLRMIRRMREPERTGKDREEGLARWVRSVARSAALDHLRRESRRRRREARRSGADGSARTSEENPLERSERLDWLRAEVAELAPSDRRLLTTRFFQDGTLSRSGASEGITVHAAAGRIRRLLARLRERARERFGHE